MHGNKNKGGTAKSHAPPCFCWVFTKFGGIAFVNTF